MLNKPKLFSADKRRVFVLKNRVQKKPYKEVEQDLTALSYDDLLKISHAVIGRKRKCGCIAARLPARLVATYGNVLISIRTQHDMNNFVDYVKGRSMAEVKEKSNSVDKFLSEISK